jgi:hypothetical protein
MFMNWRIKKLLKKITPKRDESNIRVYISRL